MDRIQAMQIFMRVAETGSFVQAAETPLLPSSTVSSTIKTSKNQVRLLNRTTRRVNLTLKACSILASAGNTLIDWYAESSLTEAIKAATGAFAG